MESFTGRERKPLTSCRSGSEQRRNRSPGLGSSAAPLGSHSAATPQLGSTRQHSAALGNSATRQLGSLDSL